MERTAKRRAQLAAFGLLAFLTAHLMLGLAHAPVLLSAKTSISWAIVLMGSIAICNKRCPNFLAPLQKSPQLKRITILGLCLLSVCIVTTQPAQALFFGEAESFFLSSFPQAATGIPIIFFILRAILILYMGVSMLSVFRSFQQGEDWISAVRPMLVVLAVVEAGDILTSTIIS